jgi:hypothetical protein
MLDGHADILRRFKIKDDDRFRDNYAKIEFVPVDWFQPETWAWRVDEPSRPEWLTESMEAKAKSRVIDIIRGMILVDGDHDLLLDGCWIVGGTANITDVRGGRMMRVAHSATIRDVRGSATISGVRGSATISGVRGSATISGVRDSATIHDVGDSATIMDVRDSATIRDVWGSATIRNVWGSATISGVWDSATIRNVWGSATISGVWDSATISDVCDSVILDISAKKHLAKTNKENP